MKTCGFWWPKGPVIGSMFVAGFVIEEERLEDLEEIGVKDSKKLSDVKRDAMAEKVREAGEVILREVKASELNDLMDVMTINEVELQAFVDVIESSDADRIYVDLPEPDGERFISKLKDGLPERFRDREFVAEHGADDEYPTVSAASIVAKTNRERHVEELKRKYGYDIKSGYPHDQEAVDFIRKYLKEHGELPPEARTHWSTTERVVEEVGQRGLDDY
ncbi:MAG: ribonuclease HII [Candidatus Nanohaloarchaea archaeon]